MDNLDKLIQEETWDMDDGSQTNIFQRVLGAYATKPFMKLPKSGKEIIVAATWMDCYIKVLIAAESCFYRP